MKNLYQKTISDYKLIRSILGAKPKQQPKGVRVKAKRDNR